MGRTGLGTPLCASTVVGAGATRSVWIAVGSSSGLASVSTVHAEIAVTRFTRTRVRTHRRSRAAGGCDNIVVTRDAAIADTEWTVHTTIGVCNALNAHAASRVAHRGSAVARCVRTAVHRRVYWTSTFEDADIVEVDVCVCTRSEPFILRHDQGLRRLERLAKPVPGIVDLAGNNLLHRGVSADEPDFAEVRSSVRIRIGDTEVGRFDVRAWPMTDPARHAVVVVHDHRLNGSAGKRSTTTAGNSLALKRPRTSRIGILAHEVQGAHTLVDKRIRCESCDRIPRGGSSLEIFTEDLLCERRIREGHH